VHLARLWLTDFRCYQHAELELATGITVVSGANAQGKTSLLEAVAWAATGSSFRGVPDAALVRAGRDVAIVRTDVVDDEREQRFEAEIHVVGRNRVQVNGRALRRVQDRASVMRVTVFAPDDLQLVKAGPAGRRAYLDDLLVTIAPRYAAVRGEYDRILRQRNALLKQGLRTRDDEHTLDVFDTQLAASGAELVRGRLRMLDDLVPLVDASYRELAGDAVGVGAAYESSWLPDPTADPEPVLRAALRDRRRAEQERRVTLAGPHRDEWRLEIGALDSRVHSSQGEQRTLALALRVAGHRLATDVVGSAPILLLDDVFSELDEQRAAALLAHLDSGQTLVTTAGTIPTGLRAQQVLRVDAGRLEAA
jgi:DNA replication and repair protein RecF